MRIKVCLLVLALAAVATVEGFVFKFQWLWLTAGALLTLFIIISVVFRKGIEEELKGQPIIELFCADCGKRYSSEKVSISRDRYGIPWWDCPGCGKPHVMPLPPESK